MCAGTYKGRWITRAGGIWIRWAYLMYANTRRVKWCATMAAAARRRSQWLLPLAKCLTAVLYTTSKLFPLCRSITGAMSSSTLPQWSFSCPPTIKHKERKKETLSVGVWQLGQQFPNSFFLFLITLLQLKRAALPFIKRKRKKRSMS